ncbi:MAG: c-type cytochrome [Myxococcales bacterium]|nr:c-type cytochrome [Myxococcales bacterium]
MQHRSQPIARLIVALAALTIALPAYAGEKPVVRAPDPSKSASKRKSGKTTGHKKAPRAKVNKTKKPPSPPKKTKAKSATKPKRAAKSKARAAHPGRAAFTALQCQLCHSVVARGIGKKRGPGNPPDLSTVGRRYSPATLRNWLRQRPNIRGTKHPFPFTGTSQQLTDLIAWLLTLK